MSGGVEPLPIADAMPTSTNTGSAHSFHKRARGDSNPRYSQILTRLSLPYLRPSVPFIYLIYQRKITQNISPIKASHYGRPIAIEQVLLQL